MKSYLHQLILSPCSCSCQLPHSQDSTKIHAGRHNTSLLMTMTSRTKKAIQPEIRTITVYNPTTGVSLKSSICYTIRNNIEGVAIAVTLSSFTYCIPLQMRFFVQFWRSWQDFNWHNVA